ncbi:CBS domain-containing protein [Microvirga pudoricolor]|uniref:CBS domain-containing protein n=1 Tax=Microvirga pudoricolor TaxID=2778729 RepID=UPI0019503703|nr:CBS domain-containing protein [Microvirga pudoricolor]MBM6596003.1 CBS domain-containing protein [Microvirga pudoricolor]
MSVNNILQTKGTKVATIASTHTMGEAIKLLAEWKIGALLVTDGVKPVAGIISERDIVRAIAHKGHAILGSSVADHMTRDVVTCTSKSDITDIMELMTRGRFRHLPVVENDRLVGVISIGDVVKHRLAEIEAETQAIKDYIATA